MILQFTIREIIIQIISRSICFVINSSQKDKILELPKLQAFADDRINVPGKQYLVGKVKKHCEKRTKCW